MTYLIVKWLHVLSSTLLFGTGFGSAYYMFFASRTRDARAIATVVRLRRDRRLAVHDDDHRLPARDRLCAWRTWPASRWTTRGSPWSFALYFLAGACWLPVVWMQIRMRDMAVAAAANDAPLPRALLDVAAALDGARRAGVRRAGGGVLADGDQADVAPRACPCRPHEPKAGRAAQSQHDHRPQGPGARQARPRRVRRALSRVVPRSGLRTGAGCDRAARGDRMDARTRRAARRRVTRKAGAGLRRSGLRPVGRLDRRARAHRTPRSRASGTRRRASRVLLIVARRAQRRHLPRRDVEDLPARDDRARTSIEDAGATCDLLDLSLLVVRVRPPDLPVQGLRVDGDAAVPLAVQLLSQPRARADRRLDERDLRALDRRARRDDRHAGVLVPGDRARSS